ncbi:MAG: hypothetical protein NC124_02180 [Clostridium sp.]|nr:hypothetical protein [Clostridium sp.]
MKYSEYLERCLDTWGKGHEEIRILVGIEEEFGELSGKVKRFYRGDYDDDYEKFAKDIIGEIGDCLYYLTMAINTFNGEVEFDLKDVAQPDDEDIFTCWKQLMEAKRICLENKNYVTLVENLLAFGNRLGFYSKEVIGYNITKLQDRKRRGVIKGTGDNR